MDDEGKSEVTQPISDNKVENSGADENSVLNLTQKKKLFFAYELSFAIIGLIVVFIIIQFVLAISMCAVSSEKTVVFAGVIMAACNDFLIPVPSTLLIVVLGLFLASLLGFILFKHYKKLEIQNISRKYYLFKVIVGIIIWLLILAIFFLNTITFDFVG